MKIALHTTASTLIGLVVFGLLVFWSADCIYAIQAARGSYESGGLA